MKATMTIATAAGLAALMSVGCVHRTFVRDRGAMFEKRQGEVTVNRDADKTEHHVVTTQTAPAPASPVVVVQPAPPPPAPTEMKPAAPAPDYVWVQGAYEWQNNQWVWTPGHWERPAQPSAVWEPGRWESVAGGWRWQPGHWR